jgi:hypothetical protein
VTQLEHGKEKQSRKKKKGFIAAVAAVADAGGGGGGSVSLSSPSPLLIAPLLSVSASLSGVQGEKISMSFSLTEEQMKRRLPPFFFCVFVIVMVSNGKGQSNTTSSLAQRSTPHVVYTWRF